MAKWNEGLRIAETICGWLPPRASFLGVGRKNAIRGASH
jgi:hypothetical protein